MATVVLGAWLFILAGTIANIALPHLVAELDVPEADIVWISVAFQIAAVSLTIPMAGLADTVGFRRMYVGGLVLLGLGSAACGLATDFTQLAVARMVQGLGAAALSSVNTALIRRIFPERMVGRGVAIMAVTVGAAQGAAPIIGSFILEIAHWRWLFFYDLPLTIAAVFLALWAIPKDLKSVHRFDALSAALCLPALGLSFFALDRLARAPTDPLNLSLLAIGLVALLALVLRQRGRARPLFPTDLFRLPRFVVPLGISISLFGAQALALTALPFVLVRSLGLSLIEAGALLSIVPMTTLVTAPLVGTFADRRPRWPLGALGGTTMTLGFLIAWAVAAGQIALPMTPAVVLIGVGFGMFQPHNARALILSAPIQRIAAAGGVQSTARVTGMMIGPALVGISFHAFGDQGPTAALIIGACMTVIGAALGFTYTWITRHSGGGAVG